MSSSNYTDSSPWLPTSIPWVDCFTNEGAAINVTWQCANLTVPIDYRNASSHATTKVGIARGRPNELQKPLGALFSNRGGPSGAMIMAYVSAGAPSYFKATNRQYDIMLVDPRGTGWSTHMTCGFTTDSYSAYNNASTQLMNAIQLPGNPLTKDSLAANVQYFAASAGSFCSEYENKNYLAHMNTPNVVRDLDLIRNLTGHEMFDYWGWSYGTIIGAMYAQMYPDKVGKVVLDGVCDYPLRQSSTSNILDYSFTSHAEIPRILSDFAAQCIASTTNSTKYCPLAINSLNTTNPALDLLSRMTNVLGNLTSKSYKDPQSGSTVSYMSLAWTIRNGLMSVESFPMLAQAFLDAETLIHNHLPTNNVDEQTEIDDVNNIPVFDDTAEGNVSTISTSTWNKDDPLTGSGNAFVFPAVTCLDTNYNGIDNLTSFVDYVYKMVQENPLQGYFGVSAGSCLSWPNLTSYDVEKVTADNFPTKLANKVLVIGVTDDPVTPYPGALTTYEMLGEDNAAFLVHEAFGHCSIADPNNCTWLALQNYFINGMLPVNGSVCSTDNSGTNNLFVANYKDITGVSSNGGGTSDALALGLGIGLGLGIPLLIGLIVLVWWGMKRRRAGAQGRMGSQDSGPAMSEGENKEAPSVSSAPVERA